jgi:beta-lactamase regulating signal transducer with metallopeptidase domain
MTPLAQAIAGALIQFVWQGFLAAFAVSLAMFLLRHASPRVRYLAYCLALLALGIVPVITAIALYDPLASNRPGPASITLTIRAVWSGGLPAASALNRWLIAAQPWILDVWIAGVAFLSLRLIWTGRRIAALRRSGAPPNSLVLAIADALARRMGMRRTVRILVSRAPDGPGLIGWLRPVVLLPTAAILNLTPDQLEAILAHELAHLRRYDDVVNIAQSIVETIFFYHPAVWWISNRIRHERELCCDDLAVRASGSALCYARALAALERMRSGGAGLALAALGDSAPSLEYRIHRIVDARQPDDRPSALPGMIALVLAAGCMMLYSNPARGSAPPPPLVEYPESARLRGIEGTVPVQVEIDALGDVSQARAIGGPKELRPAAIARASSLHFAPEASVTSERVDVAFKLEPPPPPAVVQPLPPAAPVSRASVFRSLLSTLELESARTAPASLDSARRAARQLLERYGDFLDSGEELLIHNTLASIAQAMGDDATAEAELRKVLELDPGQAAASYALAAIYMREMALDNEFNRYSEAIYEFIRSLKVTGSGALPPDLKAAAESALRESYASYHGSMEGLEELMSSVGDAPLPPADFHVAGMGEIATPLPRPYAPGPESGDMVRSERARGNIFIRTFTGIFHALRRMARLSVLKSRKPPSHQASALENSGAELVARRESAQVGGIEPDGFVEREEVHDRGSARIVRQSQQVSDLMY